MKYIHVFEEKGNSVFLTHDSLLLYSNIERGCSMGGH